ncbi:unnamed protein product, partial [Allacma fusca]
MTWVSSNLKFCHWPGNSSYQREFKKQNCVPGPKWKTPVCKIKHFSADLEFLRKKR